MPLTRGKVNVGMLQNWITEVILATKLSEILMSCWQNLSLSPSGICSNLPRISNSFLWNHLCNGLVPWGTKALTFFSTILSAHIGNRDITCQIAGSVTSRSSWTKLISILWMMKKVCQAWVDRPQQLPCWKAWCRSMAPNVLFIGYPNGVFIFSCPQLGSRIP